MGDYEVSSELYSECGFASVSVPTKSKDNVVSEFKFKIPAISKADFDGDLVVERKPRKSNDYTSVLQIEYYKSTALNLVGLQVWRGALLLADWLIYNSRSFPEESIILELGSGVGLTSIIAAMFKPVLCTDIDKGGILELIKSNVSRNKHLVKYLVQVLELDFFSNNFGPELETILPKVQVIIAADVIYDDSITEAFVNTLRKLIAVPPKKSVYIGLEKRFVFTIADCATCAPCYEYFLECLKALENVTVEEIAISFPQYFYYDRVKELVLLKVQSNL